jgi:hypothetical protein
MGAYQHNFPISPLPTQKLLFIVSIGYVPTNTQVKYGSLPTHSFVTQHSGRPTLTTGAYQHKKLLLNKSTLYILDYPPLKGNRDPVTLENRPPWEPTNTTRNITKSKPTLRMTPVHCKNPIGL